MLTMLTRSLTIVAVAGSSFGAPGAVRGQAPTSPAGDQAASPTVEVTSADPLAAIVAAALQTNLGLAQERLAERRAAEGVREARARLLPSLSFEARRSHFDGVPNVGDLVNPAYAALNRLTGSDAFPTDLDLTLPARYESHLRLVQPLFNEPARAGYAAARALQDGQSMQLRAAARRLAAEVQIAYLEQAAARRVVEIYESALALVHENERVAERLLDAGSVTPEAVQRARAERAEVEQALAEAHERRLAAGRAFNLLLKRPVDAPIEAIPDSAFEQPLPVGADAALQRGLAGREELRQIEAGFRAADAARRAASRALLPSVAAVFDYGYQGSGVTFDKSDRVWSATLAVSWSLWNGGGDQARRAAAAYEIERARMQREDVADKIGLEIRTAFEAATVARDAIATADTRLEAASRTYTLVRRRYEEGMASSFELVEARAAMTQAQLNRVLTAYRYAIRRVDLERSAALRDLGLDKGDAR